MIEMPKFKTLAEEARWFEEHAKELDSMSIEGSAEDDERVRAYFAAVNKKEAIERAKAFTARQGTKSASINIRIPHEDLALARQLAEKRGMRYQTYLKSLLHEALQREAGRA
jgi:predicted DNA binding CopG/RHH family protein